MKANVGDTIEWTFPKDDMHKQFRGKTFRAEVACIHDEYYCVYAPYGQDHIPFKNAKPIKWLVIFDNGTTKEVRSFTKLNKIANNKRRTCGFRVISLSDLESDIKRIITKSNEYKKAFMIPQPPQDKTANEMDDIIKDGLRAVPYSVKIK